MGSKEYYERWLKIKDDIDKTIVADNKLQELAAESVGLKPQGTAVEIVAKVYAQYCSLYNKLCEYYDQMDQVQRRPYIRILIDAVTCRLMEVKSTLESVEVFEYTYPDNGLKQMLIIPQDIEILCPFFYPFEIREQEMQYIIDQIFSGNRLGDPSPTASEIERKEQERLEEELRLQEQKEEEMKKKIALGEDIVSEESVVLSPEEIEQRRLEEEYNQHVNNIQRMERSRYITRQKSKKFNKDAALYLELAGLKKPEASEYMKRRAGAMIKNLYRRYMQIKRDQIKDNKLKQKLQMIMSSQPTPSAKTELKKVQDIRRSFRKKYYEQWLDANVKEKTRILRFKEGYIMDDITEEIRYWFRVWYKKAKAFDEFPWPDEGGTVLVVRGDTLSVEEYMDWRIEEEKRLKKEAGNPKSKEQIKAEKLLAKQEKIRIEKELQEREKKNILDYKKSRLNPANDPGVYIKLGNKFDEVQKAWYNYENQWKDIDVPYASVDVIKGYIKQLLIENVCEEIHLQLRSIVDTMMKLEWKQLSNALKNDYNSIGAKLPLTQKRKKPRKMKKPKPDKVPPITMFQELFDEGIIRDYPRIKFEDFWGDRNYGAADLRAIEWTPAFPPPCLGDVKEQVRIRCMLTLGCSCPDANRSLILVGPAGSGKRTLVYALATETNALLIDLSPFNVYNKFPGPKNMKTMFTYINRVSRLMQPTIILIANADKTFYKKVPPEEKMFEPTRLQKDLFKEIIKPITETDRILIVGTASEPWLSRGGQMLKVFPSIILFPRSDYGSISYILKRTLMQYHAVKREFDVHCLAQVLRGFDVNTIKKGVETLMNAKRIAELNYKPLEPSEVLFAVMDVPGGNYVDLFDYDMFWQWYLANSPWGPEYLYLMAMLESQLVYKMKEKKKKK